MSPTAVTKPVLPPLQTPKTASFPSEICSTPISACVSAVMKQEQDLKTPITPPTAYTDFLKALTPILASPPPSALHRSLSDDSNASKESGNSHPSDGSSTTKSPTSNSLPPPTPLSATSNPLPRRASTGLKRLRIPQHSPVFSPTSTTGPSPRTAYSNSSIGMVFSPYSPVDWTGSRSLIDQIATPRSACSKPVSVRSVVTRTVTYKRTTPNLEPAPKGKRRKTASSTSSVTSSGASVTSEDETKKMPPPPIVSVKDSSCEEPTLLTKVEEQDETMPSAVPEVSTAGA